AQHEHVKRIIILGQRLRDEPVIGRVIDGRVEHAVELDEPALLVKFVLHARAEGDLDDGVVLLRDVFAGSDVVPKMNHDSKVLEITRRKIYSHCIGPIWNGNEEPCGDAPRMRSPRAASLNSPAYASIIRHARCQALSRSST